MAIDVSLGLTQIGESAIAIAAVGVSILAVMILIAAYAWTRRTIQGGFGNEQCAICGDSYPPEDLNEEDTCSYCAAHADTHHGGESDESVPCEGCFDLYPESELDENRKCAECHDYSQDEQD